MKISITTNHELTEDVFGNVIITALEGGSNYWYMLNLDEFKQHLSGDDTMPVSERIAKSLYNNPDFTMNVYDAEEPDDRLGYCTQSKMMEAFITAATMYPAAFDNLVGDDYDADDADILFQLAVLGDVVFG